MLSDSEVNRLVIHVSSIFNQVILPDVSPEGYVLAADPNGSVYEDPITTHHLVELCAELSPSLTKELIHNATVWFFEQQNTVSDPFFISTALVAEALKPDQLEELVESIISNQRKSGYIDLYAGFLDGGNIFSTLWAIKILNLTQSKEARESIKAAFSAIDRNWADVHRTSFKGFYLEQLIKFDDESGLENTISSVVQEIVQEQGEDGLWDKSHFYTPYVLGNLCVQKDLSGIEPAVSAALREMFDLEKQEIEFPAFFSQAKQLWSDSPYLQLCMRALISAIRYLRLYHGIETAGSIASGMFGLFPHVYQSARLIEAERKKMVEQYGQVREHFEHLEKSATESILSESEYEKNVFVMMPFRYDVDDRYEAIVDMLRVELDKHGFKAWLASDKTIRPQLWDNVASFMLACKYGIAVFTRIEKDQRIKIDEFNPNVSLELGFFVSRGKNVLLLKDKALPKLPSDLVGHLYQEFDLNRVRKQLPAIISKWVQEVSPSQAKSVN